MIWPTFSVPGITILVNYACDLQINKIASDSCQFLLAKSHNGTETSNPCVELCLHNQVQAPEATEISHRIAIVFQEVSHSPGVVQHHSVMILLTLEERRVGEAGS